MCEDHSAFVKPSIVSAKKMAATAAASIPIAATECFAPADQQQAHPIASNDSAAPKERVASWPITKEIVMKECVKHGFYRTPSCNEKLYLHHKGFDKIAGLEEYTECRVLWLEGNCLRKVEGLESMHSSLRQLYLHNNMFDQIENLEPFTALDSINLSDNNISRIEGFGTPQGPTDPAADAAAPRRPTPLDTLTTLQMKNNKLRTADDIALLPHFALLAALDLSHNKLDCGDALLATLRAMPQLKSLYLTGNPCVRTIPNYRRAVVAACPNLRYLDDRPVFDDERRAVTAWAAGGAAAEKAERQNIAKEVQEKHERHMEEFREMVRVAQRQANGSPVASSSDGEDDEGDDSSAASSSSDEGGKEISGGRKDARQAVASVVAKPAPVNDNDNKTCRDEHVDPCVGEEKSAHNKNEESYEASEPPSLADDCLFKKASVDGPKKTQEEGKDGGDETFVAPPGTGPMSQTKFDALWKMAQRCPQRAGPTSGEADGEDASVVVATAATTSGLAAIDEDDDGVAACWVPGTSSS